MITSDTIRGYTDTMILYILMQNDSYGYEISKEVEQISDGKYSIKETTLYSAVNRLEKNGYVVSYYGDETFGKQRIYYKITNLGRSYYLEKCNEWILAKSVIDQFIKEEA